MGGPEQSGRRRPRRDHCAQRQRALIRSHDRRGSHSPAGAAPWRQLSAQSVRNIGLYLYRPHGRARRRIDLFGAAASGRTGQARCRPHCHREGTRLPTGRSG
ncbi:hypothetical protein MMMB2_4873 [Mycobacterium marinum MB2]|nr:hypothetical protein MMMB2_4873 [Mycobacterium marinum MB2]